MDIPKFLAIAELLKKHRACIVDDDLPLLSPVNEQYSLKSEYKACQTINMSFYLDQDLMTDEARTVKEFKEVGFSVFPSDWSAESLYVTMEF